MVVMDEEPDDGSTISIDELDLDYQVAYHLQDALSKMGATRTKIGRDHPAGRHCSIAITELEKVVAYWSYFVTRSDAAATEPVLEDGWQ
jgi:hypothetical protein